MLRLDKLFVNKRFPILHGHLVVNYAHVNQVSLPEYIAFENTAHDAS